MKKILIMIILIIVILSVGCITIVKDGNGKEEIQDVDKQETTEVTDRTEVKEKKDATEVTKEVTTQPSTSQEIKKESVTTLSGNWQCQSQTGPAALSFQNGNKFVLGDESFTYSLLPNNVLRTTADGQTYDYTYTYSDTAFSMTYSDGLKLQCTPGTGVATATQSGQVAGTGQEYRLQGYYCTWAGSSDSVSGYSRSGWVQFDGQGKFTYGSEATFSSDAGIAYGGEGGGANGGTYQVSGNNIQLNYNEGGSDIATVYNQAGDGTITELMYNSDLYAPELCE